MNFELISAATEVNKLPKWKIIRDATITNTPTWTDVNTTDSVLEYSTDATINIATGTELLDWNMSKIDSFFEKTGNDFSAFEALFFMK